MSKNRIVWGIGLVLVAAVALGSFFVWRSGWIFAEEEPGLAILYKRIKATKFEVVDPPRGVLGVGAIVSADEENGVTPRGHLRDCFNEQTMKDLITRRGFGVPEEITGRYRIKGSAQAKFVMTASTSGEAQKRGYFKLTIDNIHESFISEPTLKKLIREGELTTKPECQEVLIRSEMTAETYYILINVIEAQFTYEFYNENDDRIDVEASDVGQTIDVGASADAVDSISGGIRLREPMAIGMKKDLPIEINDGLAGIAADDSANGLNEILAANLTRVLEELSDSDENTSN